MKLTYLVHLLVLWSVGRRRDISRREKNLRANFRWPWRQRHPRACWPTTFRRRLLWCVRSTSCGASSRYNCSVSVLKRNDNVSFLRWDEKAINNAFFDTRGRLNAYLGSCAILSHVDCFKLGEVLGNPAKNIFWWKSRAQSPMMLR